MKWMVMPLRRYADFHGRSRRQEYWMFQLLLWTLVAAFVALLMTVTAVTGGVDPDEANPAFMTLIGFAGIVYLALFIPMLAVKVRRFHDRGMSGWCVLLGLIPYVGWLIVLAFMVMPGTEGVNDYGEDPKSPDSGDWERVFA